MHEVAGFLKEVFLGQVNLNFINKATSPDMSGYCGHLNSTDVLGPKSFLIALQDLSYCKMKGMEKLMQQ